MTEVSPTYVSVIGASVASPELAAQAEELGGLLAEAGCVVVCGGRDGVMAAVARGVKRGGGMSIGIMPEADRSRANDDLTYSVCSAMGYARNLSVVASGDVVIAVGGAWGTLSEIALARNLGRTVVLLDSWTVRPPGADPSEGEPDGLLRASTPAEAVQLALASPRLSLATPREPAATAPAPLRSLTVGSTLRDWVHTEGVAVGRFAPLFQLRAHRRRSRLLRPLAHDRRALLAVACVGLALSSGCLVVALAPPALAAGTTTGIVRAHSNLDVYSYTPTETGYLRVTIGWTELDGDPTGGYPAAEVDVCVQGCDGLEPYMDMDVADLYSGVNPSVATNIQVLSYNVGRPFFFSVSPSIADDQVPPHGRLQEDAGQLLLPGHRRDRHRAPNAR